MEKSVIFHLPWISYEVIIPPPRIWMHVLGKRLNIETFGPGHVCIVLQVGAILVHSLLRRFGLEPVWVEKRIPSRNHGHRSRPARFTVTLFPMLSDSMAKDCFVFQRLWALHFPLKFIWFANCLHVRKGGLQFPFTAWGRLTAASPPTSTIRLGSEGPGEPWAWGGPLGGTECWHNAPFSTQNKFCWLWHFNLMKD